MTRAFLCVIAPVALATLIPARAQAEGDPQVVFNNACRTCHTTREGDHRLGPSLHGIIGRKAGSVPGYAFSPAMRSSAVVWDEKNLDEFIANPDKVVHGNAMKPYGGIDSAEQRATIVAFLKSVSAK